MGTASETQGNYDSFLVELRVIKDEMAEIKSALKGIVERERVITEISIATSNAEKNLSLLWDKHDTQAAAIADTDQRFRDFQSRHRGAIGVLLVMLTLGTGLIGTSIGWLVTKTIDSAEVAAVHKRELQILTERIDRMEKNNGR